MRRLVGTLAAVLAGLPLTTGASAQDARVLGRRSHSIVITSSGGTTVGVWGKVSDDVDIGMEAAVRVVDEDDTDSWFVSLRPSLKSYWASSESVVAPYWSGGLEASWLDSESSSSGLSTSSLTDRTLGGFVGVGLDWFPVERVSVGGHLGVEAGGTWHHQETPAPLGGPPTVRNSSGFTFNTFSSGIRLQLYL